MSHEILDRSYDKETGELTQFLVLKDGRPELKRASPENVLLYDPKDELPFENGLYEFLNGEQAIQISAEKPEIIVAPTNSERCYILKYEGNTVETTPKQAKDILEAIKEAIVNRDFDGIESVYDDIISNQVRRPLINALKSTFDESDRIEVGDRGWWVDEFYLVNWEASMYVKHDDPEEDDYKRGGGGVTTVDKDHEFVNLTLRREIEPVEVSINGESFRLSEREMLFIAKVTWLLDRREYHPDQPFWKRADRYAAVDWKTGEPDSEEEEDESDEGRNLDEFSL